MNVRFRSGLGDAMLAQEDQFNLLCMIQEPDMTQDKFGQQLVKSKRSYITLVDHTDIPCIRSTPNPSSIARGASEMKQVSMTQDMTLFHILLFGFYPNISAAMQLEITFHVIRAQDGMISIEAVDPPEKHDILGVESDSRNSMTRLLTQILIA